MNTLIADNDRDLTEMLQKDLALSCDEEEDVPEEEPKNEEDDNREDRWKLKPIDMYANQNNLKIAQDITEIPLETNETLVDPRLLYSANPNVNTFLKQRQFDENGEPQVVVPPGIRLTASRWYYLDCHGVMTAVMNISNEDSSSECSTCYSSDSSDDSSGPRAYQKIEKVDIQTQTQTEQSEVAMQTSNSTETTTTQTSTTSTIAATQTIENQTTTEGGTQTNQETRSATAQTENSGVNQQTNTENLILHINPFDPHWQ
jgi:hypothetical protein